MLKVDLSNGLNTPGFLVMLVDGVQTVSMVCDGTAHHGGRMNPTHAEFTQLIAAVKDGQFDEIIAAIAPVE